MNHTIHILCETKSLYFNFIAKDINAMTVGGEQIVQVFMITIPWTKHPCGPLNYPVPMHKATRRNFHCVHKHIVSFFSHTQYSLLSHGINNFQISFCLISKSEVLGHCEVTTEMFMRCYITVSNSTIMDMGIWTLWTLCAYLDHHSPPDTKSEEEPSWTKHLQTGIKLRRKQEKEICTVT